MSAPNAFGFTEWSRGDASDMDGQPIWARERERTSQTPYKCFISMELARLRAAVPNFSGLTACQPRIIYQGRLSPHDLKKRLDESVVTAESDLKLLREILERI